MTSIPANGALLFEQATDWFIRMRAVDATADDLAEWLGWIEADPAHRTAFDQVQHTWRIVGALDPRPLRALDDTQAPTEPTATEAANEPVHAGSAVDEHTPTEPRRPHPDDFTRAILAAANTGHARAGHRRKRHALRWIGLGLAAGIAAMAVLPTARQYLARGWYAVTHTAEQRIASDRGDPRAVLLPDGTRVRLGAATGLQLSFTPRQRLVEAAEGEAFYRVKHDAKRPFVVRAGAVTVTAVGTAFSVRREAGTVSVVVAEGAVDVDSTAAPPSKPPVRAEAGQRVRFDRGKLADQVEPVHADIGPAWTPGQLRFEEEPLRVVVASLNRYTRKPIVLHDPALRELQFTGIVFDNGIDDWLAAAPRLFPVQVRETPNQILLSPRPRASQSAQ